LKFPGCASIARARDIRTVKMAGPTGFEPATSRLTIWRPNQAERRPLVTLPIAEDRNDKTISSGWSRLKFNMFVFFLFRLPRTSIFAGRRNRDRTCDLCLVRAALSQLSYPPDFLNNLADATKSTCPCQSNLALFLQNFEQPDLCPITSQFCNVSRSSIPLPPTRPWEISFVDLFQPLPLDVGINLRRGNRRMPQHRLHGPEIRAAFEQMRGEGVS
jgi:hypothetical protein